MNLPPQKPESPVNKIKRQSDTCMLCTDNQVIKIDKFFFEYFFLLYCYRFHEIPKLVSWSRTLLNY